MKAKWLYRLESTTPENGLWYNSDSEYVWGCKNAPGDAKNLPMGYDERYHTNGKDWFSSCSNKEDLLVVIGPHIRRCCYEVSEELKEKFLNTDDII